MTRATQMAQFQFGQYNPNPNPNSSGYWIENFVFVLFGRHMRFNHRHEQITLTLPISQTTCQAVHSDCSHLEKHILY